MCIKDELHKTLRLVNQRHILFRFTLTGRAVSQRFLKVVM